MTIPSGLGAIIAIVVLVLAIFFTAVGQLSPLIGGSIAALALARLL